MRDYLEVMNAAFAGPGPVDVENDAFRVHNPLDVTDSPTPVLVAALAPVDAAASRASTPTGTILWMADERAIAEHVVPRITKAAAAPGRPAPRIVAGVPVALCADDEVDAAREHANKVLGHAEYSPNYQRLLEHGDATDVGDMLAAGERGRVVDAAAAASATPASPTSASASSPSARTATSASSRGAAPRRSSSSLCPEL